MIGEIFCCFRTNISYEKLQELIFCRLEKYLWQRIGINLCQRIPIVFRNFTYFCFIYCRLFLLFIKNLVTKIKILLLYIY